MNFKYGEVNGLEKLSWKEKPKLSFQALKQKQINQKSQNFYIPVLVSMCLQGFDWISKHQVKGKAEHMPMVL